MDLKVDNNLQLDINFNNMNINTDNNNMDIDNNNNNNNNNNEIENESRIQSKTKMSSRGPVTQEYTVKGSTPSGKPRLFVCQICTRAFSRQEHLKRHERSHTKEKPFTCNICSRKFSRRDLLLRHSTKLHAGASDIIPRLRKRSIKHMSKDELNNLSPEELEEFKNRLKNKDKSKDKVKDKDKDKDKRKKKQKILSDNKSISTDISSLSSTTNASISTNFMFNPSIQTNITIPSFNNNNNSDKDQNSLILSNDQYSTDINQTLYNNFQLLYPLSSSNHIGSGELSDISSSLVTVDNELDKFGKSIKKEKIQINEKLKNNNDNNNDNDNDNDNEKNNEYNNDNEKDTYTQYPELNDLQPNSLNYFRRASFSAMSGVNYALTNPEPYASETVEFSTPQFLSLEVEQEKWLNAFAGDHNEMHIDTNNNDNNNEPIFQTEIQQLSKLITKAQNSSSEDFNSNSNSQVRSTSNTQSNSRSNTKFKSSYPVVDTGYSFYDIDTMNIAESLFKTRLSDPILKSNSKIRSNSNLSSNSHKSKIIDKYSKDNRDSPFKKNSPIAQNEILNKTFNSLMQNKSNNAINFLDKLNLHQLERLSNDNNINNHNTNINNNQTIDENKLKNNLKSFTLSKFQDNNDLSNLSNNTVNGLNSKILSWQETLFNQPISDLEKINDMHVSNKYGIPQGYSFYDESAINFSMNMNMDLNDEYTNNHPTVDTEATISPILLEPSPSNEMDIDEYNDSSEKIINNNHNHNNHIQEYYEKSFEKEFNENNSKSYSHSYLFTNYMIKFIKNALSEYPFFGTPTPDILPVDVLNYYVDQFIFKFLTHHPFIHKSILNEYWIIENAINSIMSNSISVEDSTNYKGDEIKYIRDENFLNNFQVSIICLPLLITTIGAVVSNKKEDASNLYEISRRCIHVYLDSRKNLKTVGNNNNNNSNSTVSPLWLIQSLTLSIIYGLFADEEITLSVIIRQVHALNAMIKSSQINEIQVPDNINEDFKIFLDYESTIRTIHMIFHVSTLLSTLYNIFPSLIISDLNINLPNATLLWDCVNEEEYKRLIENFEFTSVSYKHVIKEIIKLNVEKIDSKTGLINNRNFLLDNHVSEFGLICLQNALHQLVYFKQLNKNDKDKIKNKSNAGEIDDSDDDEYNIGNHNKIIENVLIEIGNGNSKLITIEKIHKIGNVWNLMVKACVLYNKTSEVYNDCNILNHYLNLKLSSIVSLNKIKESVWLKSFTEINEQYFECFNYGDDELKNEDFQKELIQLIENSIDILKLVFFNEDNSLIGTISPSFELNNKVMKSLDKIYSTPPPIDDSKDDKNNKNSNINKSFTNLNKINLNILHKLSIDSQILFDVILIIVKFLSNYENFFKIRMRFNNLSNFIYLQHFELNSTLFVNSSINNHHYNYNNLNNEEVEEALNKFDKVLFKYYLKFFKIFLNLEQFLKHNYNYEDFETGQAIEALNKLGKKVGDATSIDEVIKEHENKYKQEEETLNKIVSDDLNVLHDHDLIMSELVGFKLPFKFLKMGGFLFGFIYDKNYKFVNFKHLSDVLFHLRIFLESKEEYV